jgi:hypothetical protein
LQEPFNQRNPTMKKTILTLALVASAVLAGADSSGVAKALTRFRADTALANNLWRQAAHQDSAAFQGRVQAQTIYQLAVQHLSEDTTKAVKK